MKGLPEKKLIDTVTASSSTCGQPMSRWTTPPRPASDPHRASPGRRTTLWTPASTHCWSSCSHRGYRVILRPHPEWLKRCPQKAEAFAARHRRRIDSGAFEFQTDFSSGDTVYQSDLLITDPGPPSPWSSSFTTRKPSLVLSHPHEGMNPNYRRRSSGTSRFPGPTGPSVDPKAGRTQGQIADRTGRTFSGTIPKLTVWSTA